VRPEPRQTGTRCERLLVVVPTYDEAPNIEAIVRRLRISVPTAHLLVVDDASPDGTGWIADRMAATDRQVHVLHRRGKGGLGAAYVAGFSWGMGRGFDVFVQMDADGSHQPEQLPLLLARLGDADFVLGSRWVPGGAVLGWPRRRRLISRGGTAYARLLLGIPVKDATGGYRAIRRETMEALQVQTIASEGYCFQIEMVWRAVRQHRRVAEVPIAFVERQHGRSKMSGAIVREALWRVTVWGLAARLDRLRRARTSVHGSRPRQAAGPRA
jgi:dolichol-phosphate mannosyltransferase